MRSGSGLGGIGDHGAGAGVGQGTAPQRNCRPDMTVVVRVCFLVLIVVLTLVVTLVLTTVLVLILALILVQLPDEEGADVQGGTPAIAVPLALVLFLVLTLTPTLNLALVLVLALALVGCCCGCCPGDEHHPLECSLWRHDHPSPSTLLSQDGIGAWGWSRETSTTRGGCFHCTRPPPPRGLVLVLALALALVGIVGGGAEWKRPHYRTPSPSSSSADVLHRVGLGCDVEELRCWQSMLGSLLGGGSGGLSLIVSSNMDFSVKLR